MKKMYFRSFPLPKVAGSLAALIIMLLGFTITGICQCNVDYSYSNVYNILNSDTALTNFQVKIIVNTQKLVSTGKMNTAGNDIRFTDTACNNLSYWIENGMNTDSTIIWVKVNSLAAFGTTPVRMYYGNSSAAAASNGSNTFVSFDDFESGSLNGWKTFGKANWSVVSFNGSMRLKGSSLVAGSGSGAVLYSGSLTSYVVDADYYNDNSNAMGGPIFEFKDSNNYYAVHSMTAPTNVIMQSKITSGSADYTKDWKYNHVNNTWYKWNIVRSPLVNTVHFNGDSICQLPRTFGSGAGVWGYGSSNSVIYFDNVRVRKFSDKVSLSQTVLPVVLSSFTGVARNNNILLTWKTETEQNVAKYEIERSADGISFSEATELSAKGTGGSIFYNWSDTKPYSGANYYRLKIVDKDGKVSYSGTVGITIINNKSTMLVAPNPVSGNIIHLWFTHLVKDNYSVTIYNNIGQKIFSEKLAISQENGAQAIPIPATIPHGIYTLKVTGKALKTTLPVLIQ